MEKDFKYLNVPALLGAKAWMTSSAGGLIEDLEWAERLKARLRSLVDFFRQNDLLLVEVDTDISTVVLMFSDFTDEGKQLIKSRAVDQWLASFDRNPAKHPSDVTALTKKLQALRTSSKHVKH